MKSGLVQGNSKGDIAHKLHYTLVINMKTRSEVSYASDFPGLNGSPHTALVYNHDILVCERAKRRELQSGTTEPLP
ncbi:MAG: hypothetical protein NVS2B12_30700 [Ktedonobacteraceae bacterium]